MSFTLTTAFKTEEDMQKMKSFFEKNEDLLTKLRINSGEDKFVNVIFRSGEELPYCPEGVEHLLGFNKSIISDYHWDLISWAAIKANNPENFSDGVIYYDSEKIFVRISEDYERNDDILVKENGIRHAKPKNGIKKMICNMLLGDAHTKQKQIMEQLDNKWNEFNLNQSPKLKIK